MNIRKVFIMGAGVMGSGIAQVMAQAGYSVTMQDISDEFIQKALNGIEQSLGRVVRKGTISEEEKASIVSRISTTTDLSGAKDADLVIEAIPEELELKSDAFMKLDSICPERTILASNTSALPISALAATTKRQPDFLGIHFMNPVPVMKGVELIRCRHTSDETFQTCKAFVESLGKEPGEAVDYAGFVASRVLDAMLNEAVYCIMDGNRPAEVDKLMKTCCNFPMGPLELCDLAGVDIVLHGLEALHAEFGDRLRPAPLLKTMVRAGDLGRKTGRGFYDYTEKA